MRTLPLAYTALFSILSLVSASGKPNYDTHSYYVVEHDENHASLADVSHALGVEVVGRAGELPNHWIVRARKDVEGLASRKEERDRVLDVYARLQQRSQDFALSPRDGFEARAGAAIKYLSRQTLRQRVKRAPVPVPQSEEDARGVAARLGIQDPLFTDQWHLFNEENPEHSMNVVPLWDMGLTGKGVISAFIDDGLDYTSEDLKDNFDADDSYDFNDHEPLPTPKNIDDTHGTRCAGQVAGGKNSVCGVGIAYNSKVAGTRILSGPISDVDEAAALNYGFQNVSLYSCSWGPPDTGTVMEGPDYLINKAVLHGINEGRGGKGSIFVFASGNGAAHGDQCNFDGYTNSIYSVTVSAVDYQGSRPYYSEGCTANMVAAYSSGSGKHITTCDKGINKCTSVHGGTSAAAPNAVGVFALALEARPDLTWRDVQHLCVETGRMINPDDGWEVTAAGRNYSNNYGYGVLDGVRFVEAARKWKLVKPQTRMLTKTVRIEDGTMKPMGNFSGGEVIGVGGASSTMSIKWDMMQDANFEKLEHIVVRVWIQHTRRGDVEVSLTSPNGVTSVLAEKRRSDSASTGFPGWDFMTIKHWGEDPVGDWTLTVSDQASSEQNGTFLGWSMVFWGSAINSKLAVKYELPHQDPLLLPPGEQPLPPTTTVSKTKTHTNPTVYLTSVDQHIDSTSAKAETQPTSSGKIQLAEATASQSSTSSSDTSSQVANLLHILQKKLVIGIIVGVLLIAAGGFFLWRWTRRAKSSPYIALPEETATQMSETRPPRPTVAGEDSDDEADENTGLNSGPYEHRFHSGFLDDEDDDEHPPAAGRASPYRDEQSESSD